MGFCTKRMKIGDIVEYLDVDQPVPVVVVKIDGPSSVVCLKQKNGHKFNTTIEYLRPIPLTAEMLEKNGFVLENDGWVYYQDAANKEQNYICIGFRHNNEPRKVELNYVNKAQMVIRTIYYVHQLQHAISLCEINKQTNISPVV